jgi:homoserine kinase
MKFKVSVPATSANVGPGFDVMGIAFDLYNRFSFETIESGVRITGCPEEFQDPARNLVYTTLTRVLAKFNKPVPPLHLHIEGDLPISGGLGSSSSCIVAGVMAASEFGGLALAREEILRLSALIEGHHDNVAPAILGGFVVAVIEDEFVYWHRHKISDKLTFYAMIPNHSVSTEEARAILPTAYSRSDCVYNMSRIPLLVEGLETGNRQLIRAGCKDRLHQAYRAKLIPDCDRIFEFIAAHDDAVTVYISGAGPTLMAILDHDDHSFPEAMGDFLDGLSLHWTIRKMAVNHSGCRLKKVEP